MSGRIEVLPPELASQIAAGEVVERPASAVKELVENSLDAGASRVDVEVDGGGITRLLVSDDGWGMSEEDARRAVLRHATSKLRSIDDLHRLGTFGFRGEALPTIASVSRFQLETRPAAADQGIRVTIEGVAAPRVEPVGIPPGTRVEVRDLFYNVPARRKFLRATGTEAGHVSDVVDAVALARPDITFTLRRDGRLLREWLRTPRREERVRQLLEDDDLAAVIGERGPLRLEAYLARPERARPGTAGLRLLVNGRLVRDRSLAATVAQAYGTALERGRYPRGVVYLDLDPALVDVNVHPQKLEVRFADPRAVTDAVHALASRQLASTFALPPAPRSTWTAPRADGVLRDGTAAPSALPGELRARTLASGASAARHATTWNELTGPSTRASGPLEAARPSAERPPEEPTTELEAPPAALDASAEGARSPEATGPRGGDVGVSAAAPSDEAAAGEPDASEPARFGRLRFLGQLRRTFLVCEGDDGLYVLDQHAAAERVGYHRLRRAVEADGLASQALLFPAEVSVTEAEADTAEANQSAMARLGLEVRRTGPTTLAVHGIPRLLDHASPEQMVRELVGELGSSSPGSFGERIDRALSQLACHGALRAGDPVSADEARALLSALDDARPAARCSHGRPVVSFESFRELERRVGRR